MNTVLEIAGIGDFYLPIAGGPMAFKTTVLFSQRSGRYMAFIEPPAVISDDQLPGFVEALTAVEKQIAWLNERQAIGQVLEVADVAV